MSGCAADERTAGSAVTKPAEEFLVQKKKNPEALDFVEMAFTIQLLAVTCQK